MSEKKTNQKQNKIEEKDPLEVNKTLWQDIKGFIKELLNITKDKNEEGTIQSIKDGISMKGHTAWILVFSIIIASIGLNANSTAVVIGAMLISPLMGPILGIGLAVGINDMDTLKRSLINLSVMIGLSVITSFLFFSISLFQEATPELLARTKPDVRDVLIALGGGLALIVAISRPSPQTNTVAGVAIATALMPPLCTAGYGLALGNWEYFYGAMFLFTINSIFIAIATFVIVKFLGFRVAKYMNSSRRKRISRITSIIALIVVAGSVYSFYHLIVENKFKQQASKFISELKEDNYAILANDDKCIDFHSNSITIPIIGKHVSKEDRANWDVRLKELGLGDVNLVIHQEDNSELLSQVRNLQELYSQNQKIIVSRDESIKEKNYKIGLLEQELSRIYSENIPFDELSKEVKLNYPNIVKLSYYKQAITDFSNTDTLNVFEAKWDKMIKDSEIVKEQKRLKSWLQFKLDVDSLRVDLIE